MVVAVNRRPASCRSSLQLFQKPDVIFEKMADIPNSITQHGNALDAHSKRETGIFFTVYIAGFQHVWIDHATPQNFEPAGIFAHVAAFAATD